MEMKEGIEHGKLLIYFNDGNKYVEHFYEEGSKTGVWRRWNRAGELMEETDYSMGVPVPFKR